VDVLTDTGSIKVQPTLQLSAHPEIFAVRDVVDLPEQKQLFKAQSHAAIVAPNIVAYLPLARKVLEAIQKYARSNIRFYWQVTTSLILLWPANNPDRMEVQYIWVSWEELSRTLMIGMMKSALGQ